MVAEVGSRVPAQRAHLQVSGLDRFEHRVEERLGVAVASQRRNHLDVGDREDAVIQAVVDDADHDAVVSQFVTAGVGIVGDLDVELTIGCLGTVAVHEIAP